MRYFFLFLHFTFVLASNNLNLAAVQIQNDLNSDYADDALKPVLLAVDLVDFKV
jgi:hypothetical protein